jgi:RNA polymerase sigma-54 factor
MNLKNDASLLIAQRPSFSQTLQYSLQILAMDCIELAAHVEQILQENPFLDELEAAPASDDSHALHSFEFMKNIAQKQTFHDDFLRQLSFLRMNEQSKTIALQLLDHIRENRYINSDVLQRISKTQSIAYGDLIKIIKKLKEVEPVGLFSFNLQDKIAIIFNHQNLYDTDHAKVIRHIDVLLKNGLSALKTKFGLSPNKVENIIQEFRQLNLISNVDDDEEEIIYKLPDIMVEEKSHNTFVVAINQSTIPTVRVNHELYEASRKKSRSDADKNYIRSQKFSAELLVKSIVSRNTTLMRIVQEIVHRQHDFFAGGSDLMPIDVKSIAYALMINESTVYRAISNKIVSTPRGCIDIKSLMPKEIKCELEDSIATDYSIREYMKNLISKEPKHTPYSDSNIVHLLNSRGIEISRRTVTKYRNYLNIPNVFQRMKTYTISD